MRLSALFENQLQDVLVPWKVEGIGGREVDEYVNLFTTKHEVASVEEAEARAQHMLEAIRDKKIQVPEMHTISSVVVHSRSVGGYYVFRGSGFVIPYGIEKASENLHSCYFNIKCKTPKDSPLFRHGIKDVVLCAPTFHFIH